jgi:hypothetical protein
MQARLVLGKEAKMFHPTTQNNQRVPHAPGNFPAQYVLLAVFPSR